MFKSHAKNATTIPFITSSSGFVTQEVFVVVGGLSTGKNIAPMLRGNGYSVVHVQPKRAEALGIKHYEADYICSFSEGDDISVLIKNLSKFNICAIIPGSEWGVELADILNEKFQINPHNDFSKSTHRRSKYLMQETIRAAGIRAVAQTMVDQLAPLLSWVQANGYPVVLKPEESAGTDGVYICKSKDQVTKAFNAIISSKNIHGLANTHVVVQNMLIGDEFMINTVSKDDDIIVTEIILVKKTVLKDAPLYDYTLIIGVNDPLFPLISSYVKQVLPALGFRYGAADTEVIMTEEGPTLVEVNFRLMGAFDMSAITAAIGTNQVDVLVNSYIKPAYFTLMAHAKGGEYPKSTLTAFFNVKESGIITHAPDIGLFTDIPGFHSIKFGPKKGSILPVTTSLMDSPGMVSFVGKNTEDLLESLKIFRERELVLYATICASPVEDLLETTNTKTSAEDLNYESPTSKVNVSNGLSLFSHSDKQELLSSRERPKSPTF